ncbi:unnamed protein product [Orchesella dallaii]|uniref:Peptidase S1 domain-containing protein n=1 Tax=Orchesella dallaii TaxID=48710 RepID=A0ABP1R1R8_9HEXA
MRFFIVASLLVGLALGTPIGQVSDEQVTTSLPELLARSELDATTVVVEILADEAVTSGTERARQAVEEEDEEDEEEEATTASTATGGKSRAPTRVPAPPANSSDFLAEYQYSSQFELGPKAGVALAAPASPGVVAPALPDSQAPVAQVAQSQPQPASVIIPVGQNQPSNNNAGASAVDEDEDAESEEADTTDAPSARRQPAEPQRVEESDSDNEITSDDATTVKSFASEYEYTVQQLAERKGETEDSEIPTAASVISRVTTRNETGLDDLDIQGEFLSDGDGRAACECGKLPFRVPIGEEAEINLRPWTVAIVRGGLIAGGRPHCSGVLINDRYVLTSASCMDGLHPSGIQVWLTAHSTLNNHNLNVGTSKMNVQNVVVHPNYNRGNKENDIALIRMTYPVDIASSGSYFTPVCLPSVANYNYAGRSGTIFGWGQGRVNRVCTTIMPIIENYVCKRDSTHSSQITDNMMCAGYLTPSQPVRTDDCIGDAGGPLTVQINGRTSLIGVTSWGFEFHNRGHTPTVFTKVAGYADWILHNTEDADWCSALKK